MKPIIGLVISSCDNWHPVWPFVHHSVTKYWTPHRNWPIWFITNELDPPCGIPVKTGKDKNWCETSRVALKYIESDIILWLCEDCVLTEEPDWEMLETISEFIMRGSVDVVRLCGLGLSEPDDKPLDDSLILLAPESKDKFLLQPSLWRRSVFLDLLSDLQIDPWEFEASATQYGVKYKVACLADGLWPLKFTSHVMPGWNAELVERGCWTETAVKYAKIEGIELNVVPGRPLTEIAARTANSSCFLEKCTRGDRWIQQSSII